MISFIVAIDQNFAIGYKNALPWPRIKEDMKHFREITLNHTVVMGRKTYESLGKPLKNRRNVILTKNRDFIIPSECALVSTIEEVLELSQKEDLFIIGGANIFEQMLPYATNIYLTRIDSTFNADTFLPKDILNNFKCISKTDLISEDEHHLKLSFEHYVK
jgi:dihydrofolate reductase